MSKLPKISKTNTSNYLKIGEASKILGVSIDTLRRWEKAGKIQAIRTPGGTRLYSLKSLQKINPSADYEPRINPVSTEELLKNLQKDSELLGEPDSQGIRKSENLISRYSDSSDVPSFSEFSGKKSFIKKFFLSSAVMSFISAIIVSWMVSSYISSPKAAKHLFGNNPIFDPLNKAIEEIIAIIDPPPLSKFETKKLDSRVLAVTASSQFLEINSDTQINGALFVRDTINDLQIQATPSASTLALISGDTTLTVTKTAKLDQDVSTAASPAFNTLNLSATSNQLVLQSGGPAGTLTWTPTATRTITLPDVTTTLVGTDNSQTLTNKSLSGSSNTFTNIPNSALSNKKVTVSAGTNLSGGGDVELGSSISLSLKDSPSIAGTLTVAGATTLSSTLATTGATTLSSTLAVTGATTLSSTLAVSGTTALSGATTLSSTLDVTGNTTLSGTLATTGAATFSSTINSNTFTSTALTLSGSNPVISASISGSSLTINPGSTGALILASGSSSNGCTIDSTNGNLTCAGSISGSGSSQGFFTRANGLIYTSTISDSLYTQGNLGLGTTGSAKLTVAGNVGVGVSFASSVIPTNGLGVQGNVGIGTTTADYNLSVIGTGNFTGNVGIGSSLTVTGLSVLNGGVSTTAINASSLVTSGNVSSAGVFLSADGTAAAPSYSFTNDTDSGLWRISTNQIALTTGAGSHSGLAINSSGNVGIGNTSPSQQFQINPSGSNAFVVTSGGNVGIGTTSPAYKLDVLGVTRTWDLITHDVALSGGNANTLTGFVGYSGYTNLSGGLGTGGSDSILSAQRITNTGNLVNIGSLQAGETLLTRAGTFASAVNYTAGTNPRIITMGDLNGDGKADLAVVNQNSTNVSVFINNGSGTFASAVNYTTGTTPIGLAMGDLNGDGKADMAVANYSDDTVSIFINEGNGTFASRVNYATQIDPEGVTIGDLNGDGKADMAVTNNGSASVSVFINNGTGTFASAVNYAVQSTPAAVAIGDLNGDGRADMAVTNYSSASVSVLINNGSGTFASAVNYTTQTNPYIVAFGDLNGDGKADMAVTNSYGSDTVSVFINNGNGTFATKVDYTTESTPYSVALGDVNGDGKADMAVTNFGSNLVSVFINNGNGTFASRVNYSSFSNPASIAIGDLNGDGKADLAMANNTFLGMSVLLNSPTTILYAQASTGNIGIGTSLPGSKLSIFGSVGIGNTGTGGFATSLAPSFGLALQGNLGIGTTTANYNLSVIGTGNFTGQLTLTNGSTSTPAYSFTNSTSTGIYSPSSNALSLNTNGASTPVLTLTAGGNVGIGVTNPVGALQVNGAGAIGYGSIPTSTLPSSGLAVSGNVGIGTTTANSKLVVVGGATIGTDINLSAPTSGLFVQGNVGIGATTSSNKLDVWGNARITGTLTVDGNITSSGNLTQSGNITTSSQFLASDGNTGAPGYAFTNDTDSGLWRIGTNQIALTTAGSTTSGLSINGSGNVGIGTTSAAQKFHVNSTSGFVITSAGNVGLGVTSPSALLDIKATQTSGTILNMYYAPSTTLTGSLTGASFDLNDGNVTPTNQDITGLIVKLPTTTNTNSSGTVNLRGLYSTFGAGAGINQNGAGATVYSAAEFVLPALTQTSGTISANGILVSTPSQITTGGTGNGININATGVGAGTLNGVNISTITGSGGTETALNVGTGWDSVLKVGSTTIINGSGVTQVAGGGTGFASYTTGDILYASGTTTLTNLGIGTSGQVLTTTAGVPVWATISGSSCTTCLINNPSSTAVNTISPTGQTTTGLSVRQTSTASPTNNIFEITDSAGSTKYFYVDKDGNVSTGAIANTTLTLTPTSDTTALTLNGTNVATSKLAYMNAANTSGTIFDISYGTPVLATGSLTGQTINLGIGSTNQSVTGEAITLPSTTNTGASTYNLKGLTVANAGGINNTGSGTTNIYGLDITSPAITQTAGAINSYGVNVTTPTSITTGGTAYGVNIASTGTSVGTLYGLNIGNITAGAGTEKAITIGTGWDYGIFSQTTNNSYFAGNLGIGTSDPSNLLQVNSGTSTTFINSAGNLGVGATTSSNKLDVWGNARVTGTLTVDGNFSLGGTNTGTQFLANDGNAGAPGYAFTNDTDSGLWRIGTNQIALTTGGSTNNGLSINSSGNVGIGTTNATGILHVVGGEGTAAGITLNAGASSGASTGGTIAIAGGAGGATGAGGTLTLNSGAGGSTSGNSGAITIQPGTVTSGAGGAINITGRAGVGSNNVGSTIAITAGASVGTGTGGAINITGGSTQTGALTNTAGAVTIAGGANTADAGVGGAVNINGGNATNAAGGAITLLAGSATTNDANGGNVSITGGSAGQNTGRGGNMSFIGGQGGVSSSTGGGTITITSGAGGSTSGPSGALTIASGSTTAGSGSNSGAITIQSATAATHTTGTGGTSGAIILRSQNGGAATTGNGGASGALTISTGTGGAVSTSTGTGGAAGTLSITGGTGGGSNAVTGGAGASINLTAGNGGNGSTSSGAAGALTLTSGSAGTGGNVNGGNITLKTGTASGSGLAGSLVFQTSGANTRMIIDSGGNVGIGTSTPGTARLSVMGGNVGIGSTSPNSTLEVVGTTNITGNTTIGGTLGITGDTTLTGDLAINGGDLTTTATTFNLLNTTATTLNLGGAATSLTVGATTGTGLYQNAISSFLGNVGIGTSSPGARLAVAGGGLFGYTGTEAAPTNGLAVLGNVGIGTTTANSNLSVNGSAHIGGLYQGISAPTDGLFVDGNVGIGATTSSNKLDVWGNARVTGTLTVDGNTTLGGTLTPSGQILAIDGTAALPGYAFANDIDSGLWRIGANQIALTTGGSTNNGLSINSSGNVGIGTTNPTSLFAVNGAVAIGTYSTGSPTAPSNGLIVSGNVGIGASVPNTTLYINGTAAIGDSLYNISNPTYLPNGLVGYWKMDESSGNLTDSSGNGNTGTVTGTSVVAGKYGNARSFNGSSDYVSIANSSSLTGTGSHTISAWVKYSSNPTAQKIIFKKDNDGGTGGWGMQLLQKTDGTFNGSVVTTSPSEAGIDTPSVTISANTWHQLTVVWTSGVNIKIYVDGVDSGTTASTSTILRTSNQPSTIGFGLLTNLDGYFGGSIDEVRIYNRALSTAEVADLYNANTLIVQGRVGIGTTAPSTPFEVIGNGVNAADFLNGNVGIGTATPYAKLMSVGTGTGTGVNFLTTSSAGAFGLAVLDNGNVGVGTSSPTNKLSVVGGNMDLFGGNLGIGTSSPGARLAVAGGGLFGYSGTQSLSSGTDLAVLGNVGIGTTSPNYKLEVVGTSHFTGAATFDSTLSTLSTLQLADGTNSSPALAFTNDTNTGLYRIDSDRMSFVTGGASRFTINSGGNVGVGTTSPGALFDVNGTARVTTLQIGGAFNFASKSGSDPDVTVASGFQDIFLTNTGTTYVGGSSTSVAKLTVKDGFTWGTALGLDATGETGGRIWNVISTGGDAGEGQGLFLIKDQTGDAVRFVIDTGGNIGVGYAAQTQGRLTVNGNVGIGTSTPGSKLQVNGAGVIGFGGAPFAAPTGGLVVGGNVGIGTSSPNNKLSILGTTDIFGGNLGIGTSSPGARLAVAGGGLFGYTGTEVAPTNGLAVSGNLGIGTTTANSNLSINGNAHIGSLYQGISAPTDGLFVDGNVGIGATTSSNKLDVWGNARITGTLTVDSTGTFGNGLFGYSGVAAPAGGLAVSGNVGVGTTSPLQALHVVGQCVAEGTRIRRRRKGKNGEWIEEEVPVEDIRPDDEVLSLNEKTGKFEWHEVEKTMDMGIQEVFRLETEEGKWIETTANHPYLVKVQKATKKSAFADFGDPTKVGSNLAYHLINNIPQNNLNVKSTTCVEVAGFAPAEPWMISQVPYSSTPTPLSLSQITTKWVKVSQLKTGMEIATVDGWEKIIAITPKGRIQTYDLQIANTHNFVGNDIVAHNTYINSGLNIGASFTASGITVPTNGLAVQGNIGIGTTTANSTLSVSGNAHIGSLYQSIPAPSNGLFVDGNVGIGATTSSNKLDVWGNARITGTLTVDGNTTLGGTLTPSGQILAIDGTAALPGYAFANDIDSGLWRIGANQIALTTGGGSHLGLAINSSGNVGIGNTSPSQVFQVNPNGSSSFVITSTGNVGIGFTTPGAPLSAYSQTITSGKLVDINTLSSNTLTTGTMLNIASTATSLSGTGGTGSLMNLSWAPGGSTIATGDLFALSIGSNGSTTGSLFNILDSGSSIFSISESAVTTSLPVNFTSPGDVAIAYDINFTNPTASYIKSAAPLYIIAGETFNSSDLNLQTYNSGNIIFSAGNSGNMILTSGGNLGIGSNVTTPTSMLAVAGNAGIGVSFGASSIVIPTNGLAVQGNVGIGTTTANSNLSVNGSAHIGGLYQGISAPANGLFVDGNVGIGATTSSNKLDVWGNARFTGTLTVDSAVTFNNGLFGYSGATAPVNGLAVSGNVGIGTTTANSKLTVNGSVTIGSGFSATAPANGLLVQGNVGIGFTSPGSKLDVFDTTSSSDVDILRILSNVGGTGTVKFRVDSDGDVFSDGGTAMGTPADVAENYPVLDESIEAGDIVTTSDQISEIKNKYGEVQPYIQKSEISYQNNLIGIISTKPGVQLSANTEGKPVALAGRVPVKVSTENGPIKTGDYLTSSSTPGVAMKATRPGQVIGKALESFDGNTVEINGNTSNKFQEISTNFASGNEHISKIMVFVNVSFADPGNFFASLSMDNEGNLILPKIKTGKLSIDPAVATASAGLTTNSSSVILSETKDINTSYSSLSAQNDKLQYDLGDKLTSLADAVKSQESRVKSLEERLALLEATRSAVIPLDSSPSAQNDNPATSSATPSANLAEATSSATASSDLASNYTLDPVPSTLNLTPPDILLATGSATLANLSVHSEATVSGMLTAYKLNVSDGFKSFGATSLGNTSVAGNLSVDGTLSIENGSEINVIGTLYLQKSILAQKLDIFNGAVIVDKTGKLVAQTISAREYQAVAGVSAGAGTISAQSTYVTIYTEIVKAGSRILVTPTTQITQTLAVTNKTYKTSQSDPTNPSFTISIPYVTTKDITFDWFIINEAN